MNKKKVGALVAAGLMTVGVVGGTLAWFTSWDSVTNVFDTGKVTDPNGNGVEIYEDFTSPEAVVPGDITPKLVQIKNTTNYDSFIRVKFDKKWTDINGNVSNLSTNNIKLNFTSNVVKYDENKGAYIYVDGITQGTVSEDGLKGKWIEHIDGYYYYVGRVPSTNGKNDSTDISFTSTLLKSVELVELAQGNLTSDADNDYRDKKFNVEVIAESIQADNNAYESLNINEQRITDLLAKYSPKEDTTLDAGYAQADGVTPTGAIGSVRD